MSAKDKSKIYKEIDKLFNFVEDEESKVSLEEFKENVGIFDNEIFNCIIPKTEYAKKILVDFAMNGSTKDISEIEKGYEEYTKFDLYAMIKALKIFEAFGDDTIKIKTKPNYPIIIEGEQIKFIRAPIIDEL